MRARGLRWAAHHGPSVRPRLSFVAVLVACGGGTSGSSAAPGGGGAGTTQEQCVGVAVAPVCDPPIDISTQDDVFAEIARLVESTDSSTHKDAGRQAEADARHGN